MAGRYHKGTMSDTTSTPDKPTIHKRYYFTDPASMAAVMKENPLIEELADMSKPCWLTIVWFMGDNVPTYQEVIASPRETVGATPYSFTVSFRKYPTAGGELMVFADTHIFAMAMPMLRGDGKLAALMLHLDQVPSVDVFCTLLETSECKLLEGNEEIANAVREKQRQRE